MSAGRVPEIPSASPWSEQPLPKHIQLQHDGENLVLVIRWFRLSHVFRLVLLGILIWTVTPPQAFVGSMLYTVIGMSLIYWTIAGFLNRTRVTVGEGAVDVRIGPVPWSGSRRFAASDIAQLVSGRYRPSTKSITWRYSVSVLTPDHRMFTLVEGLTDLGQAHFVEQRVEQALGITDRHIRGELPK